LGQPVRHRRERKRLPKAAAEIVEELGFLPLAIDQAAAYVREASHDLFQFLPSYRNDRKFYHSRTPKGNRTYPKSLANTWHLSFQKVQQNSHEVAELLKLLAFLNPDGILIDFLERGKEGLTAELRALIADLKKLYDALAELTRFSLIGRQDDGSPRITIHRLVQSTIKDDMSPMEFSEMKKTAIGLCACGFPWSEGWETFKLRQLGRRYQSQVIPALDALSHDGSVEMGILHCRVGFFLFHDGNFQQAAEVFEMVVKILEKINGVEDTGTLKPWLFLPSHTRTTEDWKRPSSYWRRCRRSE
jgi:hypothetical protein